jgi:hypothetical protein
MTMAHLASSKTTKDLDELLGSIPDVVCTRSLGQDIDDANAVLLDPSIGDDWKIARFRQWASRFQPCMFGRLGAKGLCGIRYEFCWINRAELGKGSSHVRSRIQQARREWKERAAQGRSHGFLVMFNAPEMAFMTPGPALVELCLALCSLYLVEHAPVRADTIYSESIPFECADGATTCLKGGINLFYASAHRTRNHDRRIPGGIMISVNSPGLLAHSLVKDGRAADLHSALEAVRLLAWASIGNGGLSKGTKHERSCSWHNTDDTRPAGECPMKHRPAHVPANFASSHYSALYHTDVLVPSKVMTDTALDRPRNEVESWPQLDLKYLSDTEHPIDHENFGFVYGQSVAHATRLQHEWPPLPATGPVTEEYQS